MDTKELFSSLYEHLAKTITELNDFDTDIKSTRDKLCSRTYTEEHRAKVLTPMLTELERDKTRTKEAADYIISTAIATIV